MKNVFGVLFCSLVLGLSACGQKSNVKGPLGNEGPPVQGAAQPPQASGTDQSQAQVAQPQAANPEPVTATQDKAKPAQPTQAQEPQQDSKIQSLVDVPLSTKRSSPIIPLVPLPIPVEPSPLTKKSSFSQVALNQPWLGKSKSAGLAQLQKFVDIAKDNPQAMAIITAGIKAAHGNENEIEALVPFVKIQKGTPLIGRLIVEQAQTNTISSFKDVGQMVTDNLKDPSWADEAVKDIKLKLDQNSEITNIITGKYFVRVNIVTRSDISMWGGYTLHDGFLAFIHELVHFSAPVPENHFENFLDVFPDVNKFIKDTLGSAGDEIEAFTNQFQLQIWLDGGRSGLPPEVKMAFDNQGNLTDPKLLYQYVAKTLDYASGIKDYYGATLVAFYNEASDLEQTRETQFDYYNLVTNPTSELVEIKNEVTADIANLKDLKQKYLDRMKRDKIKTIPR